MRIGSLCSGYGGLDMAVEAHYGATPAWFCEFDAAPSRILAHHWPDVPNYGDLTAIDWRAVEPVDLLIGGIPCQPFSVAGKRMALGDPRHLWPYMADAVRVLRPRVVVVENVSGFVTAGGLDCVITDLAALGYDATWRSVRASDVGAPHRRERVFLVAHPYGQGPQGAQPASGLDVPDWGTATDSDHRADDGQRPCTEPRYGGATPADAGGGPLAGAAAAGDGLSVAPECSDRAHAHPGGERHGGGQDAGGVGRVDGPDAGTSREWKRSRELAGDRSATAWGVYEPAIRRWESVTGRPAPRPTEPGRTGERLSPVFVEWLMGLDAGHVTDPAIGLTRAQQLKALGNGVVPQQAALALRLIDHIGRAAA